MAARVAGAQRSERSTRKLERFRMSGSLLAFLPQLLFMTRTPASPQPADVLSVMPFLSVARELAALLLPMSPNQKFRDDLESGLMAAAHQQHARGALVGYDELGAMPGERDGFERKWVLGAAAAAAVGSAVSIAGIVAYVWWHRSERAA
jgi:hypothetical protein